MEGVNKVILIGHLGQDPETKEINGVSLTKLSLATSFSYKDKNGTKINHTDWHRIQLWRGLGDVAAKYLKKGSLIYLEGRIKTTTSEENGVKRYFTDIIGESMTMLDRKSADGTQSENSTVRDHEKEALPF